MNAHLYLRVSTAKQAAEGVSLGADDDDGIQERMCREWCAFKGHTVASVHYDSKTGRKTDGRDGLKAAVESTCADGSNGLLVMYALARLGRSARDLHNLTHDIEAAGAGFATVKEDINTTTAMGRAFFGLVAVFAQLESDQTSERMRDTHRYLKAKHGHTTMGVQGFGWTVKGGQRVPIHNEQAVIARILRMRPMAHRKIAAKLNAERVLRRGKPWTGETVRKLVERETATVLAVEAGRAGE